MTDIERIIADELLPYGDLIRKILVGSLTIGSKLVPFRLQISLLANVYNKIAAKQPELVQDKLSILFIFWTTTKEQLETVFTKTEFPHPIVPKLIKLDDIVFLQQYTHKLWTKAKVLIPTAEQDEQLVRSQLKMEQEKH